MARRLNYFPQFGNTAINYSNFAFGNSCLSYLDFRKGLTTFITVQLRSIVREDRET